MKRTGRESLATQATSEGDSRQAITGGFYQRNLDGVEVEPQIGLRCRRGIVPGAAVGVSVPGGLSRLTTYGRVTVVVAGSFTRRQRQWILVWPAY